MNLSWNRRSFSCLQSSENKMKEIELSGMTRENQEFITNTQNQNLYSQRKSDTPHVWKDPVFRSAKRTYPHPFHKNLEPNRPNLQFSFVQTKPLTQTAQPTQTRTRSFSQVQSSRSQYSFIRPFHSRQNRRMTYDEYDYMPTPINTEISEELSSRILNEEERQNLAIQPISGSYIPRYAQTF